MKKTITLLFAILIFLSSQTYAAEQGLGIFEQNSDVGQLDLESKVSYDPNTKQYTITAAGEDMWGNTDAFHFVWKKLSGDMTLTADVHLLGKSTNTYRKAGLMVRQSLDTNSAYADAVIHGRGLTCLQYRPAADANTADQCKRIPLKKAKKPVTIKLQRQGNTFTSYIIVKDEAPKLLGTEIVTLKDPVYVGLLVCSHEKELHETAVFSNVKMENAEQETEQELKQETEQETEKISQPVLQGDAESTLETINIETGRREVIYRSKDHLEAPSWSPDGKWLMFISYDKGAAGKDAALKIMPADGGDPKVLTRLSGDRGTINVPSWSPDSKSVTFVSYNNQ